MIQKRKTYELDIIDLAPGGKGLAKPDGFPVFVDRALPGDRILGRIHKKKNSWAQAQMIELIMPSDKRGHARCDYQPYCGGCRWQDLAYSQQLVYKKRHVQEALNHIGGLDQVPVLDVIPSDPVFGYRNKMEFSCTPSRWLLPEELADDTIKKDLGIGLHVPGTFDKVIDIDHCSLMPDMGSQILACIRSHIRKSELAAYHPRTHEGFWRFVMLRHSVALDQWMVNIITSREKPWVMGNMAAELVEKFPAVSCIVNNITDAHSGVSTGKKELVLHGKDHLVEKLGPYQFRISANSFFQTNTRACEKLYSVVAEYADLGGTEIVLDLYSGTGTIPIWLSGKAKTICGIEIVASAVADARKNAKLNHIENCTFEQGDIKNVLPAMTITPEVVIIDPPRVGMHKEVLDTVLESGAKKLVYVSCNPATLARDLSLLAKKYHIHKVQPVDMFPHTYHIESVAKLSLKNPDPPSKRHLRR